MSKTKNQIANQKYGDDFENLTAGEKAAVSRFFKSQTATPTRVVRASEPEVRPVAAGVKATIGRVGVNGTKTCILVTGATIQTLLTQSEYGFDSKKEKILDADTGMVVSLTDLVKHNGTYAIAVEIKSA